MRVLSIPSKCLKSSDNAHDMSKGVSFRLISSDVASLWGFELCGHIWQIFAVAENMLWRKGQPSIKRSGKTRQGNTNTAYFSFTHDTAFLSVATATDCTSIEVTAYDARGGTTGCPTLQ